MANSTCRIRCKQFDKLKSVFLSKLALVVLALALYNVGFAQPNIIFILADDLGYGELGAYGAKETQTPNIDKLAASGIVFKRAYANSTVCSPSRASILFGNYPDLIGVPGVIRDVPNNNWGNLKDDLISLPGQLKQAGYQTALIGKWHLGYQSPDLPRDRGFDYFKGFVGDMMDDYYTHRRAGVNWMRENEKEIDPAGHATEVFTTWTKDYITNKSSSKNPFFLFLAYNAPHDPVQPPADVLNDVANRLPNLPPKRQKMIALIEDLDKNIGELISLLKTKGLYKNTIIIFTSDNGGALNFGASNAPLNGGKGDMLEGGIRIPCILSWPDKIQSGQVNDPFILMDFYKILPRMIQSRGSMNFQNLLHEYKRDHMIWVRREGNRFGGLAYYAISDGSYKLLQNSPFEPFKLYSIKTDSLEQKPIEDEGRKKELLKKLTEHIQKSGKTPWQ